MNADIDISDVTLMSERCMLRPWKMSDAEDLFAYASDPDVGPMAGWLPHKTILESQAIASMFIQEKKTFAIEYEGHVIGSIGIENYDEKLFPQYQDLQCRELGFVLSKQYWGRGIMPEAADRVLFYLFMEKKLDVVFCGYFDWNRQSARVQEKLGFHEILRHKSLRPNGKTETIVSNVMTRKEYLGH